MGPVASRLLRATALALMLGGAAAGPTLAQQPARPAPAPAAGQPAAAAQPKEPPAAAFLRIETGRHSAAINRIAAARGGTLLASVSDDKTARIWDPATGELIAVLRVPVADGLEGALYAVALSPDGTRLLAAGYTGIGWDGRPSLYVFDVTTERMLGRLGPLPAIVNHIAFSPDGKRFALSMGKAGISLHEASGKPIAQDKEFQDLATWVSFAADGRIAATGADGTVRLYDPDLKLITRNKVTGVGKPFSVEFAPSGEILAVGFVDKPRVDILSTPDLVTRLSPNVGDLKAGGFSTVGFVRSGGSVQLVAAGSVRDKDSKIVLRRWPDAGLGRGVDEPVADDTVTQLLALEENQIAIATAEPALRMGPLTAAPGGGERRALDSNNLDVKNLVRGRLATDKQGTRVLLALDKDKPPILIDLAARRIGAADPKLVGSEWISWSAQGGGTTVTDWRLSRQTKIGAKPVGFTDDERALSVSVAGDGTVVLGTDFRLRLFDKAGVERHALDVPGAAWGVVMSGDGGRAIAALGDGTIRTYDIAGGKLVERASVFLHRDLKRWVAWLPEGMFDHSDEGGRELVGYVLNKKRAEAPEWITFAQVYKILYAPELVRDRVVKRDGVEAVVKARMAEIGDVRQRFDAVTPPEIALEAVCFERLGSTACTPVDPTQRLSRAAAVPEPSAAAPAPAAPAAAGVAMAQMTFTATPQARFDYALPSGIDQVVLKYKVTDRGGGIGATDFFLQDRNAGRTRARSADVTGAKGDTAQVERRLALGPGINRIAVRAYDQANGVYGESRPFMIKTALPTEADKPSLFVLAAGVNNYRGHGLGPLQLARVDAEGFVAAVRAGAPSLFKKIEVIELYDDAVTPKALSDGFAKVAREAGERDTVLIYLAGHGALDKGSYFFVTQNVDLLSDGKKTGLPEAKTIDEVYARAMPQSFTGAMLIEALGAIRARNGFIFLDTCHSGGITLDAGASNLGHETGRYILTAAASVEEALDRYDDKHGVFAAAVLKAMQGIGGTAGTDGVVDNFRLGNFVRANVEILAKEVAPQHKQSARFKISSQDATPFPIVKAKSP